MRSVYVLRVANFLILVKCFLFDVLCMIFRSFVRLHLRCLIINSVLYFLALGVNTLILSTRFEV
jgi:hypothetical protein